MQQILAWAGARPPATSADRGLTADELVALAGEGLFEVAAHTQTHPLLAALPLPEQRREIAESKRALEEVLAKPVTGFSYPNGSHAPETVGLVRQSGFAYACTSVEAAVYRAGNPFTLPRLWVDDLDGEGFSRWLRGWLRDE
jgi:peptidoglycan/xylan/chitin deacetylase (PgdA/CDA1 family)